MDKRFKITKDEYVSLLRGLARSKREDGDHEKARLYSEASSLEYAANHVSEDKFVFLDMGKVYELTEKDGDNGA